jgi:D-alanine-D-alanine ligase
LEATGETVSLVSESSRSELVTLGAEVGTSLGQVDVVFPVLHGPFGEDGTVQGLLEMADVPYVGSGVLGSATSMDKEKMKILFAAAGLPVARYFSVREHEWERGQQAKIEMAASLGFPSFTKPANLGSSVGIKRCGDVEELTEGIIDAFRYDRKVIVEEAILGREFECGVIGNDEPRASVVGEVLPGGDFYDYKAKYFDDSSETIIPADVGEEISQRVQEFALAAFVAVDAAGMARVDFFYSEDRGVVVNEINTIPGFTPISMFPRLWEASGLPYPRLIDELIRLALERHTARKRPEDVGVPNPTGP